MADVSNIFFGHEHFHCLYDQARFGLSYYEPFITLLDVEDKQQASKVSSCR